ncbi:hypothetical protein L7F22_060319 [Adiantum nelumboides]|nr:hypothetical protein [Adiantum nelumboides]
MMAQTTTLEGKVKELEQQLAQSKAELEIQNHSNEMLLKEKDVVGSQAQPPQISTKETHLHVQLPHMSKMPNMPGPSQHKEEGQGLAPGALDVRSDLTQAIEDMSEGPAKEFFLHVKRVKVSDPGFLTARGIGKTYLCPHSTFSLVHGLLKAEDLYDLNPKEGTQYCEKLWNDAIEKLSRTSNEHANLSVWRLLWLCFGLEYAKAATFKAFWLIGCILQVYILKALVKIVEDEHDLKWWWGSLLVLGMFSMSMLMSISLHMCFTLSQKVGMKLRSTISMAVFNKLLDIKLFSLVGTNSGFLLNLVTNDSQKLVDAATYFNFVWFALVELGTVSTLAIIEIGASAVPGVIVAFLTQPLQASFLFSFIKCSKHIWIFKLS